MQCSCDSIYSLTFPEVIHHYTREGWKCDPLSHASEGIWVGAVKVGCSGSVGSVSSAVEKVLHTGTWTGEQWVHSIQKILVLYMHCNDMKWGHFPFSSMTSLYASAHHNSYNAASHNCLDFIAAVLTAQRSKQTTPSVVIYADPLSREDVVKDYIKPALLATRRYIQTLRASVHHAHADTTMKCWVYH